VAQAYRLIGVVDPDVTKGLELLRTHDALGSRDALILASAINAGVKNVISSDRGFRGIHQVNWLDPADTKAVDRLIGDRPTPAG
ncbi:MAG: PIN domain-containing protein, partial [Solirubrobacterales bacterium]